MCTGSELDPHHLDRFVAAQADCYERVLAELRAGRKRSHWMWFIFPQFAGLGLSEMSQRYAIRSFEEAQAYLRRPLLGSRLVECVEAVLALEGRSAYDIFGSPDDLKLHSSATLFAQITPPDSCFRKLLDKYFAGESDARTLELLNSAT